MIAAQVPIRALVVDDNQMNRLVAQKLLERLGVAVEIACDGREALDVLGNRKFEVVFMDLHMPDMDGIETTKEIRRREGPSNHTIIVALTACQLEEDRRRCVAAGMDDFLGKPAKADQFIAVLDRWIRLPLPTAD
jgi:CheY-like chemotaxis protein